MDDLNAPLLATGNAHVDPYKENCVKVTVPRGIELPEPGKQVTLQFAWQGRAFACAVPEGVAPGQRFVADLANCVEIEKKSSPKDGPPCRTVQLVILVVLIFIWYIGFGMFWGPLPVYMRLYSCMASNVSACSPGGSSSGLASNTSSAEADAIGRGRIDYGLFWVFVGVGNFCTVNMFGELSDVVGRKVAIVIPTLSCLATYALTSFWPLQSPLSVEFWAALIAVNLLGGQFAATGAIFASGNDLTDGLPPSERTKWQSILLGGCNIGIMTGCVLGGIILQASGTFITLPALLGIGFTSASLVIALVMPEPQAKSSRRKCTVAGGNPFGGLCLLLGPRGTRNSRIILTAFTFTFFGTVGVIIVAPLVFSQMLGWQSGLMGGWQTGVWLAQAIGNACLLPLLQKLRVCRVKPKPATAKGGHDKGAASAPPKRRRICTRKVLMLSSSAASATYALTLAVLFAPGVSDGPRVDIYVFSVTILLNLFCGFYDGPSKASIADEMSVSDGGLAMSGIVSIVTLAQMVTGYFFPFLHNSVTKHLGEDFGFITFFVAASFNAIGVLVYCFANPKEDEGDNESGHEVPDIKGKD